MSALDAAFLAAEDADPATSMAIASVAVFDGPPPSRREFAEAVSTMLPAVPRYRQLVRRLPWDLGRPVWVDDPDFDIGYHLRRRALPVPGSDSDLAEFVADIMSQRLDRDRPLWETWLLEGLHDNQWALLSKVHHCMVDGVAGTELYHLLLSTSPETMARPAVEPWQPAAAPTTAELLVRGFAEVATWPALELATLARALRRPHLLASHTRDALRGFRRLSGAVLPVRAGALLGALGHRRRYATAVVDLRTVRLIAKANDATVNDVVLAATTSAFRRLLAARHQPCTPRSVRTLVPVSTRMNTEAGVMANRVSCLLAELPVHIDDAVARLNAVHAHLVDLKASREAEAGVLVTEIADLQPFPVVSAVLHTAFRLPQRSLTTVTTNVPGPPVPLYLLGRRLRRLLPYVPIADRVRIGIAMLSYCDELAFGVTGDFDSGDDVQFLAEELARGIEELAGRGCRPFASIKPAN